MYFSYAIEYNELKSDWSKFSIANANGNIDDDYSPKIGMRLDLDRYAPINETDSPVEKRITRFAIFFSNFKNMEAITLHNLFFLQYFPCNRCPIG